jgi:hypothetical protein
MPSAKDSFVPDMNPLMNTTTRGGRASHGRVAHRDALDATNRADSAELELGPGKSNKTISSMIVGSVSSTFDHRPLNERNKMK